MRILILVNWNVKYTQEIINNEQSMNYVLKGEPYWFFKYFRDVPEVDVIDTHSLPGIEKFEKNKLRFYVLQALRAIPKMNKYDIIISHGMQSGVVIALWRRLFKGKAKHLVFDIGTFNSGAEKGKAMQLMQFASKSIDLVIYHSSWQLRYYKKYYPWVANKSVFVPFGIEINPLKAKITKEFEGFDKTKPYILCVGKSRCDWETVVNAYKTINTDVRLCFLGGIDEKYRYENNVIMLPFVTFDEMRDLIENAQFCILPIENVKFSFGQIRLLQQMAVGKCVVAPKTISLADYGEDKNTILFYEPENVNSCKRAIEVALNDVSLRNIIGKNAAKAVETNFTEEKMAHAVENVIGKLV